MPISRQTLSETLSDDLSTLHKARAALSNAWALRMSASLKAHFAANCDDIGAPPPPGTAPAEPPERQSAPYIKRNQMGGAGDRAGATSLCDRDHLIGGA